MRLGLKLWQRIMMTMVCFGIAVAGFMLKLPHGFRHIDKELHTAFYFLAAAFLNILFAGTNLVKHIVIFICLYLFGMAIEYGQAWSNTFFHNRNHGRYDPEDLQANLYGLLAFSACWVVIALLVLAFQKKPVKPGNVGSKMA